MADQACPPLSNLVAQRQHEAFLTALQSQLSGSNFKVLHQELTNVLFTDVRGSRSGGRGEGGKGSKHRSSTGTQLTGRSPARPHVPA
jgi:hypothetical protein